MQQDAQLDRCRRRRLGVIGVDGPLEGGLSRVDLPLVFEQDAQIIRR